MITSVIGKIFLEAYNEKYQKKYDARTFFEEIYYPLFFDHDKYMMSAGNSPLENPKLSWEPMLKGEKPYQTPEERQARKERFFAKVSERVPDASIAIGYPSVDFVSTTSGQVCVDLDRVEEEEIFLSWIGSGLGVTVKGGQTILFNHKTILLDIYEGWAVYRELLNRTPFLRGNQINTWNGQWLAYRYSNDYDEEFKTIPPHALAEAKAPIMEIQTQSWTNVLLGICKKNKKPQMLGCIYNVGQTNTTIGFIPFVLSQIRRPYELYEKLYGPIGEKAEAYFGTAFGFGKACQQGFIGIKALEPKGLREVMAKGKIPSIKADNEDTVIKFNTYITWIVAMLNNEELWEKSQEIANALLDYERETKNAKTTRKRQVEAVVGSLNKKNFISNLTEIVETATETEALISAAALVNGMPADNVPYFLTLIRFHYAIINNSKQ